MQELTLNGYHFHAEDLRLDYVWPELSQLKSLRLEDCVLEGEDLTQILSRASTKLRSLSLFSARQEFRKWEFPSFFADSLEELWIEDCCVAFDSQFTSYSALRYLHLEWFLFPSVVPFVPPNLLGISITVPQSAASSAPNYHLLETTILSLDLPRLKVIRIKGKRGYPLLNDELQLRRNLRLKNINLVIELVHRGEGELFPYPIVARVYI